MNITDERMAEIAADAVDAAIADLIQDRMGLGELLSDDLPEDASEQEQEAEMDRLEAAIRRYVADEDDDDEAPDVRCTVCGHIVLCTDGDWWHDKDAQDLDHDASPPGDDQQ